MSVEVVYIEHVGNWDHEAIVESVLPHQKVYFVTRFSPNRKVRELKHDIGDNLFTIFKEHHRYDCFIQNNVIVRFQEHHKKDRFTLYIEYYPLLPVLIDIIDSYSFC